MTCNNNHMDCVGPVCTKATGPKRALIGKAREKAEMVERLSKAAGSGYREKQTANQLVYSYYGFLSATAALQAVHDVFYVFSASWVFNVRLECTNSHNTLTVTYKRIKD